MVMGITLGLAQFASAAPDETQVLLPQERLKWLLSHRASPVCPPGRNGAAQASWEVSRGSNVTSAAAGKEAHPGHSASALGMSRAAPGAGTRGCLSPSRGA